MRTESDLKGDVCIRNPIVCKVGKTVRQFHSGAKKNSREISCRQRRCMCCATFYFYILAHRRESRWIIFQLEKSIRQVLILMHHIWYRRGNAPDSYRLPLGSPASEGSCWKFHFACGADSVSCLRSVLGCQINRRFFGLVCRLFEIFFQDVEINSACLIFFCRANVLSRAFLNYNYCLAKL